MAKVAWRGNGMSVRLNAHGKLRNGWWAAIFMGVLTLLLLPCLLASQHFGRELSIAEQAVIILAATWIRQLLRRMPLSEVLGRLNGQWARQLALGCGLGAALMLAPALVLALGGWISWRPNPAGLDAFTASLAVMAAVAVAEELMFRGFLFQRFVAGLGVWPAQILIGGLFLLTHLDNDGMQGAAKVWAGINIFLASILFGLAYLRTQSLALPIGIHFMANVTQGGVLGLGVSGASEQGLLAPHLARGMTWLTGGSFGLEASLPGLVAVIVLLVILFRWRGLPTPD